MDEVLDDLQNGCYIYQPASGFKFGIDAVLLADFARSKARTAMDLCTGTGIIPILLAAKTDIDHFDAVEIQHDMADMAKRSVSYNGLEDRINVCECDLKDAPELFGRSRYDMVTVNPPYMKAGGGLVNAGDMKTLSRHETACTLEDVVRASAGLLKPRGRLFMVHRPSRLADVFWEMRRYGIEPKLMRTVQPRQDREMNLVLICGIKGARPELKVLPPLVVYNSDGSYTKEIDTIYGR